MHGISDNNYSNPLITGVISSFDDLQKPCKVDKEGNLNNAIRDSEKQQYLEELKFNNAIREIFLNRFTYLFSAYEHFVIQPSQASCSYPVINPIVLRFTF